MKIALAALALLSSSVVFAAVSPYNDALNQIETVIQSPALATVAAGAPIGELKRMGSLDYQVTLAGNCMVDVALDVIPAKDGMVGAIQYKVLNVSQKRCR